MSIHIRSKFTIHIQLLLLMCMLFFISKIEGQTRVEQVYDSIINLDISEIEKKQLLESNILSKPYNKKIIHADVCYLIVAHYNKIDRPFATRFLEKELELRSEKSSPDEESIAKCLGNLATFYWYLKDYDKVLYYGNRLIDYTTTPDLRLGKVYRIMADIYRKTGDYKRALNYYNKSENVLNEIGDKEQLLKTYINKLALFAEQKEGVTKGMFKALKTQIKTLENDSIARKDQQCRIVYNSGVMHYFFKDYVKALKNYETALKYAKADEDSLSISKIYNGIGPIYLKNNNIEEAHTFYNKALLYVGNNKDDKSAVYDNLGDLYKAKKEYNIALKYYNKALYTLLPFKWETKENLPNYNEVIASPHRKTIFGYLIDKQKTWLAYYKETKEDKYIYEAEKTLMLVDKLMDYLYFESREPLSKLFWREKCAELYLDAVKICYLLNKPDLAFYYIEKNKGVSLLEKSSRLKIEDIVNLPKAIVEKEYKMHKRVRALEQELLTVSKERTRVRDSLKKLSFTAKEMYYKYLNSIEKEYPEYKRLQRQLPILKAKAIQEKLSETDLVVAYILGNTTGYILSMTKNAINIYKLKDFLALESQINSLKNYYAKPFENESDKNNFKEISHTIYRNVFPFYKDSVYINATKIKIVSDGILHALPFETLSTSINKEIEEAYLIQQKEISYVYSFSLDEENETNPIKPNERNVSFILNTFQDSTLTPLSSNSKEWFENEIYIDKEATKEKFMSLYNEASQVYVSSHAGNFKESPYLFMYDTKIYPDELYFFNTPKELVVLNACETSLGAFKEGEGVYSLARGFLNSGTKSVISTLWNINEKSGSEIFETLQLNLKKKQSKSEALRNAKLAYLEQHKYTSQSSPYYWGTIILTGNGDAVITFYNITNWIVIVVILVFLVFAILWKRKKLLVKLNYFSSLFK